MSKLTKPEIMKVATRYIGVMSGYLGDFSYRTHAEFYPNYCDLDIDPYCYEGTTRERFLAILESQPAQNQAKILRGVIERFPLSEGPDSRNESMQDEMKAWIERLESSASIPSTTPKITSDVVLKAISDAETLITTHGATSGIDRVHTALHGHLLILCDDVNIQYPQDASITQLFRLLRDQHPKLKNAGPRPQDIEQLLRGCASILDALNPVRNKTSIAHPNPNLLEPVEAMLAINLSRSMLQYLDSKCGS